MLTTLSVFQIFGTKEWKVMVAHLSSINLTPESKPKNNHIKFDKTKKVTTEFKLQCI